MKILLVVVKSVLNIPSCVRIINCEKLKQYNFEELMRYFYDWGKFTLNFNAVSSFKNLLIHNRLTFSVPITLAIYALPQTQPNKRKKKEQFSYVFFAHLPTNPLFHKRRIDVYLWA